MLNTALLSQMSQKTWHMRYEEIILGRIRCEEAPQVVPAWHRPKKIYTRIFVALVTNMRYGIQFNVYRTGLVWNDWSRVWAGNKCRWGPRGFFNFWYVKIFKCETPAIVLDEFQIYIKKNYHLSEILKFMPEISNFQSQACKPSLERQKARQYDNLDFCTLIFLFLLEQTGKKLFFF